MYSLPIEANSKSQEAGLDQELGHRDWDEAVEDPEASKLNPGSEYGIERSFRSGHGLWTSPGGLEEPWKCV